MSTESPGSAPGPAPAPVPDAHWVVPGLLLAGPYPDLGATREALVRQWLRAVLAAGILLFLDLTLEGERAAYDLLLVEESAALGVETTYVRFPVPDGGVPTPDLARRAVATVSLSIGRGRPVYVHAAGSTGRVATVVACWCREQGVDGGEVSAQMNAAQRAFVEGWPPV